MDSCVINTAMRVGLCSLVFLCYVFTAMKSRFRYNQLITMLCGILMVVSTIVVTIAFLTPDKFFNEYSNFGIMIWLCLAIVIIHTTIKGSFFEILFIILVSLNLYVNIMAITKIIAEVYGFQYPKDGETTWITAGVLSVFVPFLWLLYIRKFKKIVENEEKVAGIRYIWTIPALTYMIFYVKFINDYWKAPIIERKLDIVFSILWSFSTYVFFLVTLQMQIQAHREATAQEQTKRMTTLLHIQEGQYKRLVENVDETARLKHDWRHHLLSINGFAESENLNKLKSYLNELYPEYMADGEEVVCNNHVVNVILQHYIQKGIQAGITVDTKVDIPERVQISDTNLGIVFGNLVENALEACQKQTKEKKEIIIKSYVKGAQVIIMVKNTYEVLPIIQDGVYYSTKHEGAGIGLASVKRMVELYQGMMRVDSDKEYFTVSLLLKCIS